MIWRCIIEIAILLLPQGNLIHCFNWEFCTKIMQCKYEKVLPAMCRTHMDTEVRNVMDSICTFHLENALPCKSWMMWLDLNISHKIPHIMLAINIMAFWHLRLSMLCASSLGIKTDENRKIFFLFSFSYKELTSANTNNALSSNAVQ